MSRVAELLRSRRVPQVAVLTLMSVGFAGCSADMQTRFSEAPSPIPLPRSPKRPVRCASPAVERRELPQYSRPQSAVAAIPVPGLAAARRRCTARLSGQLRRRVGRRARDFVLCAAVPSADRDHRYGAAALGRGRAPGCAGRHHDHRRHQRHARHPGEALQRFVAPRSCRPMATRARARCRPASN